MKTATTSEYDTQAENFLTDHGLNFRATLSDSKTAPWGDESDCRTGGHRPHFRVTISRKVDRPRTSAGPGARLTFDFWGSINDGQKPSPTATAYSVLACISSDATMPETFADYCSEFGENEDSRKALQTFRRCDRFAKRLRAFFTSEEIEALQEIQ